ncbi:fibronectin type III domain-containing protein [Chryseobacterium formosus]|uniref:Fibronectin type III domain-containing protein n=1 Tax=Chryseobacterium formosus TaxID=1537363 RepID=A0ABT3XRY9_9FLAO|nr:fibronectin type III domain-containing protein [Chryseobacterium formosus]MCX8523695.1 fibronectin type III domain-containing protein [Chryseobacterium formosus]
MKKVLLMCQLFLGTLLMAQVSYTQDWTATGLNSWTSASDGGSFSRNTTASQICGTAGGTIRSEQYYGTSGQFTSPSLTGNNQGLITMAFDYKITDYFASTTGAAIGTIGMIKVEYASAATGPWTTAYTIDATNHVVANTCSTKTITFNPGSGSLYVRFNVISNSSADNYYYFDNVAISQGAAPSCLTPSAVTAGSITTGSANISWTAPTTAPASGYELYYSTSATAPTSTTTPTYTAITGTTRALSGLAANTQYYVWVRSNCTTTDKSLWSPVYTFTTPCTSADVSYTLDFDGVTTPALPSCTTVVNNGTGNVWKTVSAPTGFTGNVLNYSYNTTNPANTWFFTRGINLIAGTSYRIKYKYANAAGTTQYAEKMKVAYGTSAASAAMTNTLVDYPNIITNGVATYDFKDFTPTVSGVYYFGFQAYSALDMNQLYVDDINIDVTPLCTEPTAVVISSITTNSASVAWTAPATAPASGYQVYYSTTNTVPTATTTPTLSVTTTSTPLTPLTPATTYYVWVRANCGSSQSVWTSMTSFTTLALPPANDNCSGAIALTPGGGFAQNAATGTTIGATLTSDTTATTACQTTRYADTWYSVVVPASGNISIETRGVNGSPVTDTVLGVYSGTCGALVSVGCDDDSSTDGNFSLVTLSGQTPGSTLLIGVWNYSSSNNGTFQIAAYDASLSTSEAVKAKNDIKAYPNPFADVLNISNVSNVKSIYVMDVSGKLLKTFDKPEAALQLRELNSGMYLVVLNMKDGSKQTIKAIKK